MDAVERRKTHVAEGIPALRNLTLEAEMCKISKTKKEKRKKYCFFNKIVI